MLSAECPGFTGHATPVVSRRKVRAKELYESTIDKYLSLLNQTSQETDLASKDSQRACVSGNRSSRIVWTFRI